MSVVRKPYDGAPTLQKLDDAITALVQAINNLGAENFPRKIPWDKLAKPDWVKSLEASGRYPRKLSVKGDLDVYGNINQPD